MTNRATAGPITTPPTTMTEAMSASFATTHGYRNTPTWYRSSDPSVTGDWQKVVAGCFRTLRRACLAHPGAMSLVQSADGLPAAVFRPMEITLTALERAGFGDADALRAYSVLMTFTLGQVSYQIQGWARGVDPTAAATEGRIGRKTFPAVVAAAAHKSWDFDEAFEFGLSTILAGLRAQLQPH
jgi:TetR/AcrR family transcriptional regulator, tetracycline repressor protein